MRILLLTLVFPMLVNAQADCFENYGEKIWLDEINQDTVTIRGEHYPIDLGESLMYRWVIFQDNALHSVYLGRDGNPFLRVILKPGNYTVVRFTDYYTGSDQTGVKESEKMELIFRKPLDYETER